MHMYAPSDCGASYNIQSCFLHVSNIGCFHADLVHAYAMLMSRCLLLLRAAAYNATIKGRADMDRYADQLNAYVNTLPPTVESTPEGNKMQEQLHQASLDVLKTLIEALNEATGSL